MSDGLARAARAPHLPPDHHARAQAVDERARGAIVEAGAGSGKTTTLVQRVLGLLEDGEVPASSIAVITFTERAAAEVSERLATAHAPVATTEGEGDDGLTVTTLHGFAASLVRAFPVESGIPLQLEVLDEAAAEAERIERFRARLGEPRTLGELAPFLELADALGVGARRLLGDPRDRSPRFLEATWRWSTEHLDRIEDASFAVIERPDAIAAALAILDVLPPEAVTEWARSVPATDRLGAQLLALAPALRGLADELALLDRLGSSPPGEPGRALAAATQVSTTQQRAFAALARLPRLSKGSRLGRAADWPSRALLAEVRERLSEAEALRVSALSACQQALGQELARLTATWAEEDAWARWRAGRVAFADLLLGARRLLRSAPAARAALRRRWQRLLIDEFQDTDPLQLELACLLSSTLEAPELARRLDVGNSPGAPPVPVEPGRLFVVGDPLQSIYRFRRADPELFSRAVTRLAEPAGALRRLRLSANFRTVPEVLAWVDRFVAQLAGELPDLAPGVAGEDSEQATDGPRGPAPLQPTRSAPGSRAHDAQPSPLVGVVAEGVDDTFSTAAESAAAQAEALRHVLTSIRDHPESWLVEERLATGEVRWRPARLGDVALLVPSRTHLSALLDVLQALGIPSRTGGGVPLGVLPTFRTLAAIVRALADPSDRLAAAEALLSGPWHVPTSLLGDCLDALEDLAGVTSALGVDGDRHEAEPVENAPVYDASVDKAARALSTLRHEVAQLDARAALDAAAAGFGLPGPEQAPGELRLAWAWAERLAGEGRGIEDLSALLQEATAQEVRSPEDPLAEAAEAVSVLTIHAAKGLEFPIVIVAGSDSANRSGHDTVLTDPLTRRPLARPIPGPVEATDHPGRFGAAVATERSAERAERGRLAYVACTRARDHLVLLLHRKHPPKQAEAARSVAELMAGACRDDPGAWQTLEQALALRALAEPAHQRADRSEPDRTPEDWPWAWIEERERSASELRAERGPLPFARASHLAADPPPRASMHEGARPNGPSREPERAQARRLGIAVHQVLEQGLDPSSTDWPVLLAKAAGRAGLEPSALQPLVESALASEAVGRARRARRSWRELPVSAVIDGRRLEARLDLVWEEAEGDEPSSAARSSGGGAHSVLELADYKTTTAPLRADGVEPPQRLAEHYRLQLGASAEALERVSGHPVRRAWVVRCHPDGVVEDCLEGEALAQARAHAVAALRGVARPLASADEV